MTLEIRTAVNKADGVQGEGGEGGRTPQEEGLPGC